MRYTFTVTETIAVEKSYTVSAEDEISAREKAAIGETISETTIRVIEVLDRHIAD